MTEDDGASPIFWDPHGPPRSRLYDDLYFSREDGLAESRAVFLAGCGLPRAWQGRQRFVVAEMGFGTGLNIAALLDLWSKTRPAGGHLSIFSIEAHPVGAADAARALGAWPELGSIGAALTRRWAGVARGFHRVDLAEFDATLDLAVMDVAAALEAWSGAADAWFLDGFAPAANPGMWTAEVLQAVARKSASGARLATYTVAGQVRRGLAAAGFAVDRRPGFGRKRERLEARGPGEPRPRDAPSVVIIGAGIGGAALTKAFQGLGVEARVFDVVGPGAGASGGPAALAAPRLDAGLGPQAALFAQAGARARTLYEAVDGGVIATGALQLQRDPKDPARFAAIAASDVFEPGSMRVMDEGLLVGDAVVVDPAAVVSRWIGEAERATVQSVARGEGGWELHNDVGGLIAKADCVCVAAGMATADLVAGVPVTAVRGQASFAAGEVIERATLFGGYAIPARGGVLFGATHDRGDLGADPREADHARNRETLAAGMPDLAARIESASLTAHTGVRASTSDYLPIAGEVADGLFVLTGLGSRGFTLAPLLAEHIAALALGAPSPLPQALATLVGPGRFAERARRRGHRT